MSTRAALLHLPADIRIEAVKAARRRATDRLRSLHRDEFEAMVDDELAHPNGDRPT